MKNIGFNKTTSLSPCTYISHIFSDLIQFGHIRFYRRYSCIRVFFFHAMSQALSKYFWSLEVLGKIFLDLKGNFDIVLFLIYVLRKKLYQMDLSYIPDKFGDTILRYELIL